MLSRGNYGIEYDEDKNSAHQKHWWLITLIIVCAALVIAVRSCRVNSPDLSEDPTQAAHFDAPETGVSRERVSLRQHFFGNWFGASSAPSSDAPVVSSDEAAVPDEPAAVPKTTKRLPAQIQKLLDQATADEQAGNLLDARLTFLHLLDEKDAAELHPFFERKIGGINTTLFFSKQPVPGKVIHTIDRGDTPGKIAKKYGCPQEFIMEVNAIERPENMKIGTQLQVLDNPVFELHIAKADASARLTLGGEFFKRYALVTGDANTPPAGSYAVSTRNKQTLDNAEVIWTGLADDKPRHPQEICWIKLSPSNATLQGTRNPSAASAIRFRNPDIDELCLLLPAGTRVVITE